MWVRNRIVMCAVLALSVLPVATHASTESVKQALSERVGASVRNVETTPVPGLYQALVGNDVVLVDAKARYIVFGSLVDAETRVNLTARFKDQFDRIDPAVLNTDDAIRIVKGNGERTLHLFSDPDCPFCKQLEETLTGLDNVTIYTYLYPIRGLGADATAKSRAIWCADDPQATWAAYMLEGVAPSPIQGACEAPVRRNIELAAQLSVEGTPTLFSADGRRMAGAAPLEDIEQFLAR